MSRRALWGEGLNICFGAEIPKHPAVLKTYEIVSYYAVVFLLRPQILLRCERFLERKKINSQENGVRTWHAAIVNHHAIVSLLRRAHLLRRSIFSTAGSFGIPTKRCTCEKFAKTSATRRPARGEKKTRTSRKEFVLYALYLVALWPAILRFAAAWRP